MAFTPPKKIKSKGAEEMEKALLGDVVITTRLDKLRHEKLRKLAFEERTNISELIRNSLIQTYGI